MQPGRYTDVNSSPNRHKSVGSVPDFACFVGMVLRFHDELSIRQQFNAQKGAYKMAGTCFQA
ncbi:hypothetical protein DBO95_01750 [Yersinia pestis]|nr:hypothetical protein DBO95_01750 [Yersinia pestis]